jgi:hypothetical protein
VVIDDRRDPDRADVERQILGSLVKAMNLSRLQALARSGPMQLRKPGASAVAKSAEGRMPVGEASPTQ